MAAAVTYCTLALLALRLRALRHAWRRAAGAGAAQPPAAQRKLGAGAGKKQRAGHTIAISAVAAAGPAVVGPPLEAAVPAALPGPPPAAVVRFFPSSGAPLDADVVRRLELELAGERQRGGRNRFVCLQLATMAAEQAAAVAAAAGLAGAAGEAERRRLAAVQFAVVEDGSGDVVAAAVVYPRTAKAAPAAAAEAAKSGVVGVGSEDPPPPCTQEEQHLYVELICTRQPGCGYGRLLLQAIERRAAAASLRSVRLLSVDSSAAFYRCCGYVDGGGRELVKQLE